MLVAEVTTGAVAIADACGENEVTRGMPLPLAAFPAAYKVTGPALVPGGVQSTESRGAFGNVNRVIDQTAMIIEM
jgi:hypothetical protein